ncbi:DUF3810 domain-containing protein [Chryseobacterium salivictor]|uniref:DUF3810 domain-containing protein n=1 Tax=Chryseobacterium salivictor TaxID=2547600 RepID=A0A4P6ZFF8_9FLAO|nr:DUF3810 domain-containing protein [Chryseobacterium salivictor]QBO58202.1 hypothetical protein NBC122_01376 [Chryseobacterium salivictor]
MLIKEGHIYNKKRFWAGVLLAQFVLFLILSKIDFAVGIFERIFEFQKRIHQHIFSIIPFSVGDIFYIFLLAIFLFFIFKIIKKRSRKRYSLKLLILLNILYFTYQIFWGMLYFQKPLLEKLPEKEINIEDVKTLSLEYLERCKKTRTLVQEDQNGVFIVSNNLPVKEEILKNQTQLPAYLNNKKGTRTRAFKSSLFKPVMSYTGILGYYNPFTAEAQYNAALPSTYIPFTLSHESAHQLGYAREQEANFIGFLIGRDSKNADLKYSTEYFVLKSLLNYLAEHDRKFAETILENYSIGMKRDRIAEKLFVKKHEGLFNVFFRFTNDLFLKSNQQEGSITYSYFIDLLIRYQ